MTSLESRFWAKVQKTDGCWLWTGADNGHGYGRIAMNGRVQQAHRVSYYLHTGEIPPETLEVCHTCDNRSCIRPDHLFLGTHGDNMRDMRKKRRHVVRKKYHGESNQAAKLTEAQARAILVDRRRAKVIASEYGISPNHVYYIRSGRSWAHLRPWMIGA